MLISAEHLSINFGSRQLLDDVDFYLNEGDKTGVIGINGTGKSTFLKVLAGKLQPDGGTIARKPNLQVSVLAQNPDMRDELTVLEQVFASMPPEFRQLNEYEAKRMLTQLGLVDTDRRIGTLSGGVDSIEHGAYLTDETLCQLAESGAVWVPTLVTIGNLIGCGRFPDEVLTPLLAYQMNAVKKAAAQGARIACGSDAGAYRVLHGQGGLDERTLLRRAIGEGADTVTDAGNAVIMARF